MGIPLLSFLGFHVYLIITGKNTRETLKGIDVDKKDYVVQQDYQWCMVDESLIDFYGEMDPNIGEAISKEIEEREVERKKMCQKPTKESDTQMMVLDP